jgi:hypothetical protein
MDKNKDKDKDKDKNKNNDKVYDKDNGQSTRVEATRVGMVARQSMEKSGINSLQKKASRSAATTMMRSNGHSTGSVDDERVGMDLEESVAGQSMEKSAAARQSVEKSVNNSLQKKASRSASGTSRLANTRTSSTMMGSNGHATGVDGARVGMDLEKIAGQLMEKSVAAGQSVEKSGNTSLQKEISRSASGTSRLANTSTTMMGLNGYSTGSVDGARVDLIQLIDLLCNIYIYIYIYLSS